MSDHDNDDSWEAFERRQEEKRRLTKQILEDSVKELRELEVEAPDHPNLSAVCTFYFSKNVMQCGT